MRKEEENRVEKGELLFDSLKFRGSRNENGLLGLALCAGLAVVPQYASANQRWLVWYATSTTINTMEQNEEAGLEEVSAS